MCSKKWQEFKIRPDQYTEPEERKKQDKDIPRRDKVLSDYNQDLHTLFSIQNIPPCQLCDVLSRVRQLRLYISCLGPLYEHERIAIYGLCLDFHDGIDL